MVYQLSGKRVWTESVVIKSKPSLGSVS